MNNSTMSVVPDSANSENGIRATGRLLKINILFVEDPSACSAQVLIKNSHIPPHFPSRDLSDPFAAVLRSKQPEKRFEKTLP